MLKKLITFILIFATLALFIQAQTDPCNSAHTDKKSCLADTTTGGGCAWCQCAAVPSACYTTADAARLP